MKYRTLKKKIYKLIKSDADANYKYTSLRKYFGKMFIKKSPSKVLSRKERLATAIDTIRLIYQDEEAPALFFDLVKGGNYYKTIDFITFLEKLSRSNDKEKGN